MIPSKWQDVTASFTIRPSVVFLTRIPVFPSPTLTSSYPKAPVRFPEPKHIDAAALDFTNVEESVWLKARLVPFLLVSERVDRIQALAEPVSN